MFSSNESYYEIVIQDYCDASYTRRWSWLSFQNLDGLNRNSRYGESVVEKKSTISSQLVIAHLMPQLNFPYCVYDGVDVARAINAQKPKQDRRRRHRSTSAQDLPAKYAQLSASKSILRICWKFTWHKMVIAIDIKRSLAALSTHRHFIRIDGNSEAAPELLLHDMLEGILQSIAAISESLKRESCEGVVLTIIAQVST
jgi:hypothetical protein